MLKVNGTFYQSPINIAICLANKENVINIDIANQVLVLELDIEKNERNEEQIKELNLKIGNYNLTSEFTVAAIDNNINDIIK